MSSTSSSDTYHSAARPNLNARLSSASKQYLNKWTVDHNTAFPRKSQQAQLMQAIRAIEDPDIVPLSRILNYLRTLHNSGKRQQLLDDAAKRQLQEEHRLRSLEILFPTFSRRNFHDLDIFYGSEPNPTEAMMLIWAQHLSQPLEIIQKWIRHQRAYYGEHHDPDQLQSDIDYLTRESVREWVNKLPTPESMSPMDPLPHFDDLVEVKQEEEEEVEMALFESGMRTRTVVVTQRAPSRPRSPSRSPDLERSRTMAIMMAQAVHFLPTVPLELNVRNDDEPPPPPARSPHQQEDSPYQSNLSLSLPPIPDVLDWISLSPSPDFPTESLQLPPICFEEEVGREGLKEGLRKLEDVGRMAEELRGMLHAHCPPDDDGDEGGKDGDWPLRSTLTSSGLLQEIEIEISGSGPCSRKRTADEMENDDYNEDPSSSLQHSLRPLTLSPPPQCPPPISEFRRIVDGHLAKTRYFVAESRRIGEMDLETYLAEKKLEQEERDRVEEVEDRVSIPTTSALTPRSVSRDPQPAVDATTTSDSEDSNHSLKCPHIPCPRTFTSEHGLNVHISQCPCSPTWKPKGRGGKKKGKRPCPAVGCSELFPQLHQLIEHLDGEMCCGDSTIGVVSRARPRKRVRRW